MKTDSRVWIFFGKINHNPFQTWFSQNDYRKRKRYERSERRGEQSKGKGRREWGGGRKKTTEATTTALAHTGYGVRAVLMESKQFVSFSAQLHTLTYSGTGELVPAVSHGERLSL